MRCLYSDEDLDPYSWLLMSPSGRIEPVLIDPDRYDSDEGMIVKRVTGPARSVPVPA